MNLGVICNIKTDIPECVIVHDYENGDIGYSTYNDDFSKLLNAILKKQIFSENILNNVIHYNECNKTNSFYISVVNDYLPHPYKVMWIKNIAGNIEDILEQAYDILDSKEDKKNINGGS